MMGSMLYLIVIYLVPGTVAYDASKCSVSMVVHPLAVFLGPGPQFIDNMY